MKSSATVYIYIGGSTVALWQYGVCVAVRSLYPHDMPTSTHERRVRIMLRVKELGYAYATLLAAAPQISVVMGGPWVVYHTRSLEHVREQSFMFSPELEELLVNQDYQDMKKQIARVHGNYDEVIIGAHIQAYIFNGHIVQQPFGKKTNRCELPMIVAFGQRTLAHDTLAFLEMLVHKETIHIQSYWQWIAKSVYTKTTGIVVSVGSNTTEIMLVRQGVVEYTASIPYGYEAFNYSTIHNTLGSFDTRIIPTQEVDNWVKSFAAVLHEWSLHRIIPNHIDMITDVSEFHPFLQSLSREIVFLPCFATTATCRMRYHDDLLFSEEVYI